MLPPLDEWDESVLSSFKGGTERAFVELKASRMMADDSAKFPKTKAEIAKQVCAFANAGGGHIVLGVDDNGELDDGVPVQIGNQSIKAWVENLIPLVTFPALHGCEAKAITTARHTGGRCALVIQVPLSELRPHWVKEDSKDVPYIRAGEHSAPMPLQTFRDMIGRSESVRAEVVSIGCERKSGKDGHDSLIWLWPKARLLAGGICREWLMTLEILHADGSFDVGRLTTLATGDYYTSEDTKMTVVGRCPLIRGATVPLTTCPFALRFSKGKMRMVKATLHVPGADECSREEMLWAS